MAEEYGGDTGTFFGFDGDTAGTDGSQEGGNTSKIDLSKILSILGSLIGGKKDDANIPKQVDNSEGFDTRLLALIDSSSAGILGDNARYSKENAITDSQGVVNNIFRDYKNTALPAIFNAQNSSGGYNSTTGQLLANDAYGAATSKAADAVLKNVNDYRKLQQQDYGVLADLFRAKSNRPNVGSGGGGSKNSALFGDIFGSIGDLFGKK